MRRPILAHQNHTLWGRNTTCESLPAGVSEEILTLPMLSTRLLAPDDTLSVLVRGFSMLALVSTFVSSSIAAAVAGSSASSYRSAQYIGQRKRLRTCHGHWRMRRPSRTLFCLLMAERTCSLPVWDHDSRCISITAGALGRHGATTGCHQI